MSSYAPYHRKIIRQWECIISLKQRQECKGTTAGRGNGNGKQEVRMGRENGKRKEGRDNTKGVLDGTHLKKENSRDS